MTELDRRLNSAKNQVDQSDIARSFLRFAAENGYRAPRVGTGKHELLIHHPQHHENTHAVSRYHSFRASSVMPSSDIMTAIAAAQVAAST